MERTIAALLFVSLCVLAGCGDEAVSPASNEQVKKSLPDSAKVTKNEPRFWQDTDTAEAIVLLGHDRAVVYRWQNGVMQASGYFDTESGRETWKLNSAEMFPSQFDPQRSSGVLGVVMSDAEGAFRCEIFGEINSDTAADGKSMAPTFHWQGKVDHDTKQDADEPFDPALVSFFQGSAIKDDSASLSTYVDGEWAEFLQITFSPASEE